MIMAISVVVIVFGKIHSDYEKLDMTRASEQNRHWKYQQLRLKKRRIRPGWEETEDGWKYKTDEKTYAVGSVAGNKRIFCIILMTRGSWQQDSGKEVARSLPAMM